MAEQTIETVWKYVAQVTDHVTLDLPCGYDVLHVAADPDVPHQILFWVKVNTSAPVILTEFEIRGTGQPLGSAGNFVGTVHDGPFVWHVFEDRP